MLFIITFRRLPTGSLVESLCRRCTTLPAGEFSLLRSRVQVRTRGCRSDRAVCYLLHDPFDGVGTLTALRAAAKAVVNLAHPQPLSGLRKSGTKLLITEHVARADDHDLVLTHISGHGRNEGKQNKATAPPRHESHELRRRHVSAPCSPCFGCRDIMHVPSPSNLPSRQNAFGPRDNE